MKFIRNPRIWFKCDIDSWKIHALSRSFEPLKHDEIKWDLRIWNGYEVIDSDLFDIRIKTIKWLIREFPEMCVLRETDINMPNDI